MSKRSILLGVRSECADAADSRVFASIPFDRVVLQALKDRTQCFSRAKDVYPGLFETYEFHCLPRWYGMGSIQNDDDQADWSWLQRLPSDNGLAGEEPCSVSLRAGLARLEAQEINTLVVPGKCLPRTGNLGTECEQLVMSLWGDSLDIVELRWVCAIKHTEVKLLTSEITSEDIDRWVDELALVEAEAAGTLRIAGR